MKVVTRLAAIVIGVFAAVSCEMQQSNSPRPSLSLGQNGEHGAKSACKAKKGDKDAPVDLVCAIQVPGNPLVSVAKFGFAV